MQPCLCTSNMLNVPTLECIYVCLTQVFLTRFWLCRNLSSVLIIRVVDFFLEFFFKNNQFFLIPYFLHYSYLDTTFQSISQYNHYSVFFHFIWVNKYTFVALFSKFAETLIFLVSACSSSLAYLSFGPMVQMVHKKPGLTAQLFIYFRWTVKVSKNSIEWRNNTSWLLEQLISNDNKITWCGVGWRGGFRHV